MKNYARDRAFAEAMAHNARGAEMRRNDPEFMKSGTCPECVVDPPCLCDAKETITKMRAYYEANRRIERRSLFGNLIVEREEPKLIGSWGIDMDGLMTELFKIATRRHDEVMGNYVEPEPEVEAKPRAKEIDPSTWTGR